MNYKEAVLDTSVFIALEQNRSISELPTRVAISVVTLAELELGVLMANDLKSRSDRLATLKYAQAVRALPIDEQVASAFAVIIASLKRKKRSLRVQDAWIAATALAKDAAVCTQDGDFNAVDGLMVIRV